MKMPRRFWLFVILDSLAGGSIVDLVRQLLGFKRWTHLLWFNVPICALLGWFVVSRVARWQCGIPRPAPAPEKPGRLLFVDREGLRDAEERVRQNSPPRN